jgi:hypothetical protein
MGEEERQVEVEKMTEEKPQVDDSATSEEQETLIDWDGPDDRTNPMNWSHARKWTTIALVSFNTFNVYVDFSLSLFSLPLPSFGDIPRI